MGKSSQVLRSAQMTGRTVAAGRFGLGVWLWMLRQHQQSFIDDAFLSFRRSMVADP